MRFEGRKFENEPVDMDFNQFINCQFENCKLIYHGFGLIEMDGCNFVNVNWTFTDAAANTLKFMTELYHGAGEGGQQIINSTLENIRKGKG